jgi:DNA-binding MarR family transcriptional regulator
MDLDKQLRESQILKSQNWGKLISISRKQFEEWSINRLCKHGYQDFKIAYMPVFMNIPPEGINNNELARIARVTKQAMSKVVKELQDMGYIKSKVSPEDKRNFIIVLTDKGKKLVIECRLAMKDLMDEYRQVFGKKEFDAMLQMIQKIVEYNDQKLLAKND